MNWFPYLTVSGNWLSVKHRHQLLMAGLYELYPNGGIFGTGFNRWGLNGTARVLIEDKAKASNKGLLLEPVDEKKDRFGFVQLCVRLAYPRRCFAMCLASSLPSNG